MNMKKMITSLFIVAMTVCCGMTAFAAESQKDTSELHEIKTLDSLDSLSAEDTIKSSENLDVLNEAEPYVSVLGENQMRMVGIEAFPLAYNPSTNHFGVFSNYGQSFTNSEMDAYVSGIVYSDEIQTIKEYYASKGYLLMGWYTVATYYFKMDTPVDYYYSVNGSEEQRVALSVSDNMNPFQCEFYKTLEPGDETGTYTSSMKGRYGHRASNGNVVYNSFFATITFNVEK